MCTHELVSKEIVLEHVERPRQKPYEQRIQFCFQCYWGRKIEYFGTLMRHYPWSIPPETL